jgi:hypothetical protein
MIISAQAGDIDAQRYLEAKGVDWQYDTTQG